jgi:predicted RNase H-like HicB family nuclease
VARSPKKAEDRFDGYGVELYVDDDGDWLAHFEELTNVSAFGPSPEAALRELDTAWRLVKATYTEEGKPVPVPPSRRHPISEQAPPTAAPCSEPDSPDLCPSSSAPGGSADALQ